MKNKNVGAHICAYRERGITLIALIITMIVMLILATVTLTIALGENGIVAKTKESKIKMNRETQREILISLLEEARDNTGKINFQEIILPVGARWIKGENDTTTLTILSNTGNWIMTVNGDKFFINSKGAVLDNETTEKIDSEGGVETGDALVGKYYNRIDVGDQNYIEVTENSFSLVRDGETLVNGSCVINENDKTIIADVSEQGAVTLNVEVLQNNKIIMAGDELYSTTTIGFDYELNGEYINSDSTNKWIFNNTAHTVSRYEYGSEGWTQYKGSGWLDVNYFGYKGTYYVGGETLTTANNNQTFSCNEVTFTKIVT